MMYLLYLDSILISGPPTFRASPKKLLLKEWPICLQKQIVVDNFVSFEATIPNPHILVGKMNESSKIQIER